jgi:hypothetical protein
VQLKPGFRFFLFIQVAEKELAEDLAVSLAELSKLKPVLIFGTRFRRRKQIEVSR